MDNLKEKDVSEELGYKPVTISDQISGRLFPDQKVKRGTRWFYIILLIFSIFNIIVTAIATISILFFYNK